MVSLLTLQTFRFEYIDSRSAEQKTTVLYNMALDDGRAVC